jgi:peptide/nickel transport system permease protein
LKKILTAIPVLLVVSIVLFLLLNVMPGDAADSMSTMDATAEEVEALRESLGLNDPMYIQYLRWLKNVLKGDFGISFLNGASVTEKIVTRLPVTLELTLLAMLIAVAIALPMGVLSATHRNSAIDAIASFISMIGVAVPHFWLAMMLIIIFSVNLHWLPASGFTPISQGLGKNLIKMIMPAFSVGLGFAATVMRQTRSNMIDVLGTDYISTAKAKGMSKSVVVWKHGVRNALIPVITVIGMQTGRLFGGAIVVETLFGLPGIGTAIVQSIFSRDYQMTMGCVMMVAVIIILINTIVDILYVIIDPRVRTTRKSGAK